MATFDNNPERIDPYKNYRFKVYWDQRAVAGVTKVSALKRTTEVIEHRSGGDPATVIRTPGQTKFEAITLERGVTHDKAFEQWANKVWSYGAGEGGEVSLKDFRKTISIVVHNEAGQEVLKYNVYRCWISDFQALPELDASGNAIAIQTLKLEHEGWERDTSFSPSEPEPSFTNPE